MDHFAATSYADLMIASEETPHPQPTNAHLPANNRPRFVPPLRKLPGKRKATDN